MILIKTDRNEEGAESGVTYRSLKTRFALLFFIVSTYLLPIINSLPANENHGKKPQLVIFMIDGFRWDYYEIYKQYLPGFTRFLAEGSQTKWVDCEFPPKSFPNWETLTTGVYPDVHQIIGNTMLDVNETDPSRRVFNYHEYPTTKDPKWWQEVEPIWTTAVRYGMRSSVRFWPGCEVRYHKQGPTECLPYGGEITFKDVQETFRETMERLEAGFELIMVHIDIFDDFGHIHGPISKEIQDLSIKFDKLLDRYMDQLALRGFESSVNTIIVSDHGMTYIGPRGNATKHIMLSDYISLDDADHFVDLKWTRMWFAVSKEKLLPLYNKLKKIEGILVFLRSEIPEQWHMRNARYGHDILIVAKVGYIICGFKKAEKQEPKWKNACYLDSIGIHGYFPEMPDMRGVFYGRGPAFKKGFTNDVISMVDVYQMYGRLLDLPLHAHNGTWSKVSKMFEGPDAAEPPELETSQSYKLKKRNTQIGS